MSGNHVGTSKWNHAKWVAASRWGESVTQSSLQITLDFRKQLTINASAKYSAASSPKLFPGEEKYVNRVLISPLVLCPGL